MSWISICFENTNARKDDLMNAQKKAETNGLIPENGRAGTIFRIPEVAHPAGL
jgi:hypothetical protein